MTQKTVSTTRTPSSLDWTRADWFSVSLISIAVAVALRQLWQPGIPNPGDMLMSVHRVFEVVNGWQAGIFYPRLGPDLNFGYGAPLFQFYPPLASYIGLIFHWAGLGLIDATKAITTTGGLLATLGMYLYARLTFAHRWAALASAVFYGLAPYLLLNVYERGAVSEGWALMILPWLCWAIRRLLITQRAGDFWLASGLVAAMMLAHNITALWAIPTVAIYFGLLAFADRRLAGTCQVALALGVGLGLSAFYWLPALAEVKFTHAAAFMLRTPAEFAQNLVTGLDLFQPTLVFQYAGEHRFRFSLLQAVVGGVGLLALPWLRGRLRIELAGLALIWFITLLLQFQLTLDLWQNIPLMRFMQFPWRLFGLATFCTALLGGSLLTWGRLRTPYAGVLALGIGTLFIGANLQNIQLERLPLWVPTTEAEINQVELYRRGAQGYALFRDYSPSGMQSDSISFALPRLPLFPPFPPLTTPPLIQVNAENPVFTQMTVAAPAVFTLRYSRVFFPGWQVYANDQPVPTYSSGAFGLVTADLPAGNYPVRIQFDQTLLRRVADWVSLLTLALWLTGWLPGLGKRPRWVWLLAIGVVIGVALYPQIRSRPARQPTPYAVNFQDIVHLVGYELPKTTWRASEAITLRLYWLVQQTPTTNYKIFLHLARLDDSGQVAQTDSEPNLGFNAMTNWEAGAVIVDDQRLAADTPIPPGRYRLLLGVYQVDPLQNLLVRSAPQVLPGDRVVLTEVDIIDE